MGNVIKDQRFYRMPSIVRVSGNFTPPGTPRVHDFTHLKQSDALSSFDAWVRAATTSNPTVDSIELFFHGSLVEKWRKRMGIMSEAQAKYADLKYVGQRFFMPDESRDALKVLRLKFYIVDVKLDTSGKYGPKYNVYINIGDPIPIGNQGKIEDGKLIDGLLPEMIVSLPTNGQRDKMYEIVSNALGIKDFTVEHDVPSVMFGPCIMVAEGKRKEIVEWNDKGKVIKLKAGNDEGFIYEVPDETG